MKRIAILVILLTATTAAADTCRTIVKEVVVDAPRSEVWTAWTTSEGVSSFFGPAANVELRHRGPFEVFFDPEKPHGEMGADHCEVLSWLHEEMLSFTWHAPMEFLDVRMQRSFVVVQLFDAEAGATRVRITQGGFGDGAQWDEVYAYFDRAWDVVAASLVARFAGDEAPAGRALVPEPYRHYTYFVRPADESFLTRTEFSAEEQETLQGHVRHIKTLAATGRLICAGPCFDPTSSPDSAESMVPLHIPAVGLIIFKARSLEEAKAVMEADPAVAAGLFKAQVNEMNLAFMRP